MQSDKIVKMRSFFDYFKSLIVLVVIMQSLPFNILAQEYSDEDSLIFRNRISENDIPDTGYSGEDSTLSEKKSSWIHGMVNAFSKACKYDPEYLSNERNQLKVRLLGTVQLPSIMIHPKSDLEKRITFSSDPLKYVGADVGWSIFTLGYSLGLDRKNDRNNGRLSFSTYTRFFAINSEVLWFNNLSISNIDKFIPKEEGEHEYVIPEKIAIDGAFFRSRSLQVKFFPNGKKMAYGNTINPVFRQLRSAGTTVLSLDYTDYDFNTNLESTDLDKYEWISEVGISNMNLYKYEIGAGYSYNFVISRRWILFISEVVGLSTKHYTYKMLNDDSPTSNTKIGLCNYFRTGACYYNKDYFIGTNISYEIDALSTNQFLFNKTNLNAVLFLGYKFKVDGFNRFVSKLLNVDIK